MPVPPIASATIESSFAQRRKRNAARKSHASPSTSAGRMMGPSVKLAPGVRPSSRPSSAAL